MKSEFLKTMGLSEEQMASILEEHEKSVAAVKGKFADYGELKNQLAAAQKKLAEIPTEDVAALTAALEAERAGREKDRQTFQIRAVLEKAGAVDADYLLYKLADSAQFGKDGTLADAENFVKAAREAHPTMFPAESGGYRPVGGGAPSAVNPWRKETFNLTEQGKIFKENPAQARELMAAAGVPKMGKEG